MQPAPLTGARARLSRLGDVVGKQRHLLAMRDGVIGALPLTLAGSFFLLLSQALARVLPDLVPSLLVGYRMLGGVIALYVTFSAAHSLAKKYDLDPMASGLLAMAAFLVAAYPAPEPGAIPAPAAIPVARLGAGSIFSGLLSPSSPWRSRASSSAATSP
jgi:cellobiose PTS system EIIC component